MHRRGLVAIGVILIGGAIGTAIGAAIGGAVGATMGVALFSMAFGAWGFGWTWQGIGRFFDWRDRRSAD